MNVLRDCFETLALREILLYILPGSIVIAVVLFIWGDPRLTDLARYAGDRTSLSIIAAFAWVAAAYTVGVVVANVCRVMPRKWKAGIGTYPCYYEDELIGLIGNDEVKRQLQEIEGRQAIIERLAYQYVRRHDPCMCRDEIARFGVFCSCARHLSCAFVLVLIGLLVAYAGNLHSVRWMSWWHLLLFLPAIAGLVLTLWRGGNIEKGRQSRRIAACFLTLRLSEPPDNQSCVLTP
jgi:hypothetical protein